MAFTSELLFTRQAKKELARIRKGDPKTARLISEALNYLQFNPDAGNFLHGDLKGRRKFRVGDYRIVYQVNKGKLIVFILRIAHRKDFSLCTQCTSG